MILSKGASASVATALSAGQKHIFDQRDTWFPHTKQPTVAMWGEGASEDPNIDDFKVTGRNVSAVHQLYSNINRGVTIMSKTIGKKKNAIQAFLMTIETETLSRLLEFEDGESKFKGFRNEKNKTPYEFLSIVFSGSYNKGEACVSDKYVPYVMTEKYGDYTVTAKENWRKYFPTVALLQRSKTVDKSILEKYLVASTRHLKSSTSTSSSLCTPTASASYSFSRAPDDNSHEDSIDYYSSNNVVTNEKANPVNDMDSFESFMRVDTKAKEIPLNNTDNDAVCEYTISNNTSEKTGVVRIKKIDNSDYELEFDMTATLLYQREFKGAYGTHRWKAFQEFIVPDKLTIQTGDYVVVKGITNKKKIHIIDPTYVANHDVDTQMNSFTVRADIFTSLAVLALSPESL